jgi:hypothetical protein
MFNSLKTWIVKLFAGTWLKKFLRDSLLVISTYLMASDASICAETEICKDLAQWLGEASPIIVERAIEIIMFLISLLMKLSAGKAESVGRKVLEEQKEAKK